MPNQINVFPLDRLYRVGIVTKDLEGTARNYAEVFGIDTWKVSNFNEKRLRETRFAGQPVKYEFRSAIGATSSGALRFELIEPQQGMSAYREALATHGVSIADIVLKVANQQEMRVLQAFMAESGVECWQSGRIDGNQSFYDFDTRRLLGGYAVRVIESEDGIAEAAPDEEWDLSHTYHRPSGIGAIEVDNISHFGVVIRDLMAKVRNYAAFFGIPEWRFTTWRTEDTGLVDPYYMGNAGTFRPVNHEYFTSSASVENFGFEIIQPTFGPQHYKEDFLNIVGDGIHHMSLLNYDDEEDWFRHAGWLESIGMPICMGGDLRGRAIHFAYVNGLDKLGFVIESVIRRPGIDAPAAGPSRPHSNQSYVTFEDVAPAPGGVPGAV